MTFPHTPQTLHGPRIRAAQHPPARPAQQRQGTAIPTADGSLPAAAGNSHEPRTTPPPHKPHPTLRESCRAGHLGTIPRHATPSSNGRRKVSMKAREVMTAAVHAFRPDTPADLAAHYLHSHGYAAAPVTDDNKT